MRSQSVYVIATKFIRTKNRFPEVKIQKVVSDEDKAIIGALKSVFPEVAHSFCVFHQLKNVNKGYSDEFNSIKNISGNGS